MHTHYLRQYLTAQFVTLKPQLPGISGNRRMLASSTHKFTTYFALTNRYSACTSKHSLPSLRDFISRTRFSIRQKATLVIFYPSQDIRIISNYSPEMDIPMLHEPTLHASLFRCLTASPSSARFKIKSQVNARYTRLMQRSKSSHETTPPSPFPPPIPVYIS